MFFLLGLAIAVLGMAFFAIILGGDINNFIDTASLFLVLFPLAGVLLATQSYKVFYAGLKAAIFPKEEITEDMRGQAASLFRLLSKVSVMAGAMGTFISLINMLMNLNFFDAGGAASLGINIACALLTLLYGLLLVVVVFEPVVFILKKRSAKRR